MRAHLVDLRLALLQDDELAPHVFVMLLTLREMCGPTYTFLSLSNMPLTDLMAFSAASAVS